MKLIVLGVDTVKECHCCFGSEIPRCLMKKNYHVYLKIVGIVLFTFFLLSVGLMQMKRNQVSRRII